MNSVLKKEKFDIRNVSLNKVINYLFLFFCFVPFLFPNPIVTTNIQPYASIFGVIVLFLNFKTPINNKNIFNIMTPIFTFVVAIGVLLINGLSIEAMRGLYNYFALLIIPFAVFVALDNIGDFPEKFVKVMILMWFVVSSIQFFINRGFATQLISGVRWSLEYRGVVGLASEPSFLGIVCFYFLHLIRRFKENKILYMIIVLIMGIIYAQSAMGLIFIAGYLLVFMFDISGTKKGILIWIISIFAIAIFMFIFTTKMTDTRLYILYKNFMDEGMQSVLEDGSVENRFDSIINAFKDAYNNNFLPFGFGGRIGSAFGGMLVELGFLAIPAIIYITKSLSITYSKRYSIILYFAIVLFLFVNNTQIGNPLLLLVLGTNIWFTHKSKKMEINNV